MAKKITRKKRGIVKGTAVWASRVLVYTLLAIILLATVAVMIVQSAWFEDFAIRQIEAALADSFENGGSVSGLYIDLLGRRVMVSGLRIHASDRDRFPDPLRVDLIIIEARLSQIIRGNLSLNNIVVHRPDIVIAQAEDGSTNLPAIKGEQQQEDAVNVSIENVSVSGGMVSYNDQVVGWDLNSGDIRIAARRTGGSVYRGSAEVRNLRLDPPEVRPLQLDVGLNFILSEQSLTMRATLEDELKNDIAFNRLFYDFKTGYLEAGYNLSFDLGMLERSGEMNLAGVVQLDGLLALKDSLLRAEATVEAPALTLTGYDVGGLYAELKLAEESLTADNIRADIAHGTIRGDARVSSVFTSPHIIASLSMDGLRLQDIIRDSGMTSLRLSSVLDAAFSIDWDTGSDEPPTLTAGITSKTDRKNVERWLRYVERVRREESLEPFAEAVAPVAVDLKLQVQNGRLTVAEGSHVALPLTRVSVAGSGDLENVTVNVTSEVADAAETALALANLDRIFLEMAPEQEQLYGVASFIRLFEGKASFDFQLKGPLEMPTFDLYVRTDDISFVYQPVGSGGGHISFADNVITIEEMSFNIGEGTLALAGSVDLPEPGAPPGSFADVHLEARVENLPVDRVEWLLDPEMQTGFRGTADGRLDIYFTDPEKAEGNGHLTIIDPAIGDFSARRVAFDVSFGETLRLKDVELIGLQGEEISGDLRYNEKTLEWDVDGRIEAVQLSDYAVFFGASDLYGKLEADISLSGKGLQAHGTAGFSLDGLTIADIQFQDIDGSLKAEGKSASLSVKAGDETFRITSQISGDPVEVIELQLQRKEIDFTGLLRRFVPDQQFYLTVLDGAAARFEIKNANVERIDLTLSDIIFGLEQFSISSDNFRIALEQGNLLIFDDIQFIQGGSSGRTASLDGTVRLEENGRISLDISGGIDLFSLSDFLPEFALGGSSRVDVQVRGRLNEPRVAGSMQVSDGFLRHRPTNVSFADIAGELNFQRDRIELTRLGARFAQGSVILDGVLVMDWATLAPLNYRFTGEGRNLQLDLIEGLNSSINGTIAVSGTPRRTIIGGEVDITRASYRRRFDPEAELAKVAQTQPLPVPDETLRNIELDVGITSTEGIVIDNNFAEARLYLDLRALGTLASPGMLGRAEIRDGVIFYRDRTYSVTTGVIEFTDANEIKPQFDFRAETRVKEYRVFLEFHGTLERLFPELSSDPNLSNLDIFHLLATGDVRDNPFPSENQRVQEQLLQIGLSGFLTKQITGEFEARAEELFGIDRFRIDPFLLEDSANPTARLTVGEQINDALTVVYSTNISRQDQQVLVFEYQLSPSLVLIGTRENDGSFAVDVQLQQKFK